MIRGDIKMYKDERELDFRPIGKAIKQARETKGWTQEQLGVCRIAKKKLKVPINLINTVFFLKIINDYGLLISDRILKNNNLIY